MSDLDDFFAKKLDDEAAFPNRNKQWKQMSKRLDAFDAGAVQGRAPKLRAWQVATLAAIAVAGFLVWKTVRASQEIKVLQQEIHALKNDQTSLRDQLAAAEQNKESRFGEPIRLPERSKELQDHQTPSFEKSRPQQKALDQPHLRPLTDKNNITEKSAPFSSKPTEKITPTQEDKPINESLTQTDNKLTEKITPTQEDKPLSESLTQTENKSLQAALDTHTVNELPVKELVPETAIANQSAPKKDTAAALATPLKKDSTTTQSLAEVIKPQPSPKKQRFRVGAQGVLGFVQPKQKGVSALKGQGFSFEAKIFRALWATASVDWMHHEVSTTEFVPKFHPPHDSLPKPPNGGGGGGGGGWSHPAKLVLVESAPREQHFGVGLRYQLPIQFWVRPSVRIAHEWTRISPTLVTYQFEEDDPGGPGWHDHEKKYTAEKFDAHWLDNQWRLGIGLEKDTPLWTFGLWADYSKCFSSATPSYDALYLKAGAQFRF